MRLAYACERLRAAIAAVATAEGRLPHRLRVAYDQMEDLEAADVPEGLRPEFAALTKAWDAVTVRRMREETRGQLARELVTALLAFYDHVCLARRMGEAPPSANDRMAP